MDSGEATAPFRRLLRNSWVWHRSFASTSTFSGFPRSSVASSELLIASLRPESIRVYRSNKGVPGPLGTSGRTPISAGGFVGSASIFLIGDESNGSHRGIQQTSTGLLIFLYIAFAFI